MSTSTSVSSGTTSSPGAPRGGSAGGNDGLFTAARGVLPGGVNSPVRATRRAGADRVLTKGAREVAGWVPAAARLTAGATATGESA